MDKQEIKKRINELLRIYHSQETSEREKIDAIGKILDINNNLINFVIGKKVDPRLLNLHSREDLMQGGKFGLIHAIRNYDPERGVDFVSYAYPCIKGGIYNELGVGDILSSNVRNLERKVYILRKDAENKHGDMSDEEFVSLMRGEYPFIEKFYESGLKGLVDKVNDLMFNSVNVHELDDYEENLGNIEEGVVYEEEPGVSGRSLTCESEEILALDHTNKNILRRQLIEVLDTLSEREKEVLSLRYGLRDGYNRSLGEVAHVFEVSREGIRQIEIKALKKLRHPARCKRLRDYVNIL